MEQARVGRQEHLLAPRGAQAVEQDLPRALVELGGPQRAVAQDLVAVGGQLVEERASAHGLGLGPSPHAVLGEHAVQFEDRRVVERAVGHRERPDPVAERRAREGGRIGRRLRRDGEAHRHLPRMEGGVVHLLRRTRVARTALEDGHGQREGGFRHSVVDGEG